MRIHQGGRAFDLIVDHEEALAESLLAYLRSVPAIRIIGRSDSRRDRRVPTISFVYEDFQSFGIVEMVGSHRIGIWFGDFKAKKRIRDHGMEQKDDVVRVSLVQYNTVEEVESLIAILRDIF